VIEIEFVVVEIVAAVDAQIVVAVATVSAEIDCAPYFDSALVASTTAASAVACAIGAMVAACGFAATVADFA